MKSLRSLLVIASLLALSFTLFSSFSKANNPTETGKELKIAQAASSPAPLANPLHGDVWFAFTAIGFIGTYLAFKK